MSAKSSPFDPNKKYTVSELRTLRTRYGYAALQLDEIHQSISLLKLKYSGRHSRSTVKADEERYRIVGIDEALRVISEKKLQNDTIVEHLNAQYEKVEKYGKHPKNVV